MKWKRVFQGMSRRSSRCKLRDRKLGAATMAAHKWVSCCLKKSSKCRHFRSTGPHMGAEGGKRENGCGTGRALRLSNGLPTSSLSDPSRAPDAHNHWHVWRWRYSNRAWMTMDVDSRELATLAVCVGEVGAVMVMVIIVVKKNQGFKTRGSI